MAEQRSAFTIPVVRWSLAAETRTSRRAYEARAVPSGLLDSLEAVCSGFRPHLDARIALVREPAADVFTGIIGSYGRISGSQHVLVFIAAGKDANHAHVGYAGEAAVLEAAALGLDTCWVGGFFSPRKARTLIPLHAEEHILAVSPVGFARSLPSNQEGVMRSFAHASERKPLEIIAPGWQDWPLWAQEAAEAARKAPSAMNRQPWRFAFEDGALVLSSTTGPETPRVTKRLDCGIAMLHSELGALRAGRHCHWRDIRGERHRIARLLPEDAS